MTKRPTESPLHSPAAERAMLGACMLSAAARDVMHRELTPEDFYTPAHARVAEACGELHRVDHAVDPVTVAGWISDRYGVDTLTITGGLAGLTEIMNDCPSSTSAPTYAARIRDRSARRALQSVTTEASKSAADLGISVDEVIDTMRARLDTVDAPIGGEPPTSIADFLAGNYPYRWLIPNLLERRDRLILTGGEGGGKSTLLDQMAVQLSAGIHPFARHRFAPLRVLRVDVENSPQQLHRRYTRLIGRLASSEVQMSLGGGPPPEYDPGNLLVANRQEGIDLLTRADRRWFTAKVDAARPDIIISGPIYKLIQADPKDEEPAAAFAGYMDQLRARYDCAIVLEAHSPHGTDGGRFRTLRPIGASLWMRWPEFGYGIRPDPNSDDWDWVAWRGPRDDERYWPSRLRRGGKAWPWVNSLIDDEDNLEPPF